MPRLRAMPLLALASALLTAASCRSGVPADPPVPTGPTVQAHHQMFVLADTVPVGEIRGVVRDLETGNPLPRVILELDDSTRRTISTRTGAFRFANVAPGDHRLTIYRPGFTPVADSIQLDTNAGASLVIHVGARKSP